ncbi:PREDICTED: jmjC domain-containing protein 4-like isoform X2 [Priapulus caudatus]|uniref:Jumonji domain-containing protein 4 n=1 Tax=Priapulus caudatus TaxID=37621 RepID=A0ABM1DWL5_PRICU|nr:PREDICTED: jmjC domain-containing protein 4-like isoform X2 [Priapulus caudatus]
MPLYVILIGDRLTSMWLSRREWVNCDGTPNLEFIEKTFGSAVVSVASCNEQKFYSHQKQDMTVSGYVDYWRAFIASGYPATMPCLYLKDWHFVREFPHYVAYETPAYFSSDWLNEFWDSLPDKKDDYRFVYMGPKGSWTPFHADVFRSYSWSANICGRKKWILVPPGQEECLRDCNGNLAYDLDSPDLNDNKLFPNHPELIQKFEVIQEAGQLIFVPSGWHHQVWNLEDTISLNHNWVNGFNIDIMWNMLQATLIEVQHEIEDVSDMEGWEQQCQVVLQAYSGIDYFNFANLLTAIARHRLKRLKTLCRLARCCGCDSYMPNDVSCTGDHAPQPVLPTSSTCERGEERECDCWHAGEPSPDSCEQCQGPTSKEVDHEGHDREEVQVQGHEQKAAQLRGRKWEEEKHLGHDREEVQCGIHEGPDRAGCNKCSNKLQHPNAKSPTLSPHHLLFDLGRTYQHLKLLLASADFQLVAPSSEDIAQSPEECLLDMTVTLNQFYCSDCFKKL